MLPTETDLSDLSNIVALRDARSTLLLAPDAGGRLMRWTVDGKQVIHWPTTFDWRNPARIRGGNPLLFPFLGRHRVDDTPNQWRDATGIVRDLPQHGFARDLPFAHTVSDDGHAVTMTLTDTPATHSGYPFTFSFSATYRLGADDDGRATLDVTLETQNAGTAPLPYYAGHHFYFDLPPSLRAESRLMLASTQQCSQLPDGSISAPETTPAVLVPGDPQIQDRFHLLHPGDPALLLAEFDTPSLGRRISIMRVPGDHEGSNTAAAVASGTAAPLDNDSHASSGAPLAAPWYAVTTWTESEQSDFYCVEPWLGLPNAIHHGLGLRWVAPGHTERAALRIAVAFDR